MMGKMTSALKPVADRYNKLASDERYNFRRQVRSYIKWYGYISQVCRMFDADMQKEYVFCSYLLRLIPAEPTQMIDLDGALKLEFYKLEQTFKGDITLIDQSGVYEPAGGKGKAVPEPKEPLEEVIQKINDLFAGNFSDADRVLIYALHDRLKDDKKLQKVAQTSDPQVFAESIFPKTFDEVAQDSYVEQTEAFTSLFQNKSKYNAIMSALAGMLYREFNRPRV
jgi:type I restriction enzyme R subunit